MTIFSKTDKLLYSAFWTGMEEEKLSNIAKKTSHLYNKNKNILLQLPKLIYLSISLFLNKIFYFSKKGFQKIIQGLMQCLGLNGKDFSND